MVESRSRAPRFGVGLRVVCDTGKRVWSGEVVDLSESGMFVETVEALPVGITVRLIPDVGEEGELPAELLGVVVRSNEFDFDEDRHEGPGIAFRLKGLTLRGFNQLRDYLEKHGKSSA